MLINGHGLDETIKTIVRCGHLTGYNKMKQPLEDTAFFDHQAGISFDMELICIWVNPCYTKRDQLNKLLSSDYTPKLHLNRTGNLSQELKIYH